jgi:2,3,4,5-tetrahydropyridine-2-carboxylate N-succinyltransferase
MKDLESIIETAFAAEESISPENVPKDLKEALAHIINALESGKIRVASSTESGKWLVHEWVKKAILLYFRTHSSCLIQGEFTNFYDKIPLRFTTTTADDFKALGIRIVPPATVRRGAYLGTHTVLMPSFVNIGAYVDEGTMVDTWATVGSCAQIGKRVHLSGGVGIGGVLEPLQANPTIIEDDCFIGARSEIVEGVVVEQGAVIAMGVFIGQSTRIFDRETGEIFYGRVPANSVVVPGSLPSQDSQCHLNCAVIVKRVDAQTRRKTAINELLRY